LKDTHYSNSFISFIYAVAVSGAALDGRDDIRAQLKDTLEHHLTLIHSCLLIMSFLFSLYVTCSGAALNVRDDIRAQLKDDGAGVGGINGGGNGSGGGSGSGGGRGSVGGQRGSGAMMATRTHSRSASRAGGAMSRLSIGSRGDNGGGNGDSDSEFGDNNSRDATTSRGGGGGGGGGGDGDDDDVDGDGGGGEKTREPQAALSLALSPDSKLLAAAFFDNAVLVYDTVQFRMLRSLQIHNEGILRVCWATDRRLIVGTTSGSVQVVTL
jgi:hypothetical protein